VLCSILVSELVQGPVVGMPARNSMITILTYICA